MIRIPLPTRLLFLIAAALVPTACGDDATGPADEPEPLALEVRRGDAQQGLPGLPLRSRITVRVTGNDGLPRARSRLQAEITSGDGVVSPRQFYTNPDGLAFLDWELGPATGEQRLEVTSLDSTTPAAVTVTATALPPDATDLIVVRGASADLLGAALFVPGGDGAGNEVIQDRVVEGTDTVIPLFPLSGLETEVVIFGQGNPPGRVRASWTPDVDTVVVSLRPAIPVDLVIDSYVDSAGAAVPFLLEQAAIMESLWAEEGMGLELGSVTVNQLWRSGTRVDVQSANLCPGAVERRGEVRVAVVASIDGGQYNGWGCTSGNVWMGGNFARYPTLLAHELGHVFSLPHTTVGVMVPRPPGQTFTEGEIYRAHFHAWSGLNSVLGAWPEAERVQCLLSRPDSPCLPPAYDLGDGGS